jgi:hypothetical protein
MVGFNLCRVTPSRLSRHLSTLGVNKLCIYPVAALQRLVVTAPQLCFFGFLPTMKVQLSQLPMIVGSGRVNT